MTTTQYGSWATLMTDGSSSIEQGITDLLADAQLDFDVAAIVADYRAAIDAVLPDGVTLNGDALFGPHPMLTWWGDRDSDEHRTLVEAIAAIDIVPIMQKHEKSVIYEPCGCLKNEAGAHHGGCSQASL